MFKYAALRTKPEPDIHKNIGKAQESFSAIFDILSALIKARRIVWQCPGKI